MSEDLTRWDPFVRHLCDALGIDSTNTDVPAILDLTRIVAHSGARPMAPVSAYLLGLAVGSRPGKSAGELRDILLEAVSTAPHV